MEWGNGRWEGKAKEREKGEGGMGGGHSLPTYVLQGNYSVIMKSTWKVHNPRAA